MRTRKRGQGPPLNETQRALVTSKCELLRQASFGFTQDRLLHISEEESKDWTSECADELRRAIGVSAPPHVRIVLTAFLALRCVSLQCLPLGLLPAPAYV